MSTAYSSTYHFSSPEAVCVRGGEGSDTFWWAVRVSDTQYNCYRTCRSNELGGGCPNNRNTKVIAYRLGNSCPTGEIYDHQAGFCLKWDKEDCFGINNECLSSSGKGAPNSCPSPYAGNPINYSVGNKFQAEVDYSPVGGSVLSFARSYNSLDGLWRHNFSTYLRFAGTEYASLVRDDGRESFFTIGGTTITPTSSDLGVLTKAGTTGWQYVSVDNEQFSFDTAGKLTHWSNTQGRSYQLTYSGSEITVTDNLGNSLTLAEDADRQPLALTAPGIQIIYGYNANRRLTSVTRTIGGQTTQRQLHYEVPGKPDLLTGITDERGVRYASWAYDDQGRAISSEHAGGADRVTLVYNANGSTTVTNELGKKVTYRFQVIQGVKRIVAIEGEPSPNCPSSNSTFTYDDRGLLKAKTDSKGYITTYSYNDRGLEISRTEASSTAQARTITTEWHPTLFLPEAVTEPGRITHYQYDNQGRQLSQAIESL